MSKQGYVLTTVWKDHSLLESSTAPLKHGTHTAHSHFKFPISAITFKNTWGKCLTLLFQDCKSRLC